MWVIHRSLYAERSFLRTVSCCQLYSTITRRTRQSAAIPVREALPLSARARIPIRQEYSIVAKLVSLFEEWRTLLKSKGKKSKFQQAKEEAFTEKLKDLFDMAHQNAMKMIKIQEDRDFLNAQRQKGRQ